MRALRVARNVYKNYGKKLAKLSQKRYTTINPILRRSVYQPSLAVSRRIRFIHSSSSINSLNKSKSIRNINAYGRRLFSNQSGGSSGRGMMAVGLIVAGVASVYIYKSMASTDNEPPKKKKAPPKKQAELPQLHPELKAILNGIRAKRNFNAQSWVDEKCKLFNEYMAKCGLSGCVVNLSGGIDSAVTLGLMKRSASMPGSPIKKILAISQPIHSSSWAFNRAKECADAMGIRMVTIDQTKVFDSLKKLVDTCIGLPGGGFAGGQLKSYMRTPCIYYVAQLLSTNGTPSVVMGTGNKDEDGYLAYFCKAGDGVVDVQLISDLHKSEVFEVGKILKVPNSIIVAAPSADLWDGQTDEDELGFSYDFIEFWTNYLEFDQSKQNRIKNSLSPDAKKQLNDWGELAVKIHRRNAHKLNSPHNIVLL